MSLKHTCFFLVFVLIYCLVGPSASFCLGENVYNLQITIDPTSLTEIHNTDQQVMLLQSSSYSSWFTLWASFQPFSNNYLSWNDSSYHLFASMTPLISGNIVLQGSTTLAYSQLVYPFKEAGYFAHGYSIDWVQENQIGVINNGTTPFLFGLAQDVQVNAQWFFSSPIYVTELLGFEHDVFPTENSILVFLGSKNVQVGTLGQNIEEMALSEVTQVTFSSSQLDHVLQWNSNLGRFVLMS